jgi:hypothetical protein
MFPFHLIGVLNVRQWDATRPRPRLGISAKGVFVGLLVGAATFGGLYLAFWLAARSVLA